MQLEIYNLPVSIPPGMAKVGDKVKILCGNNKGREGEITKVYLSDCMYRGQIVFTVKVPFTFEGIRAVNIDQLLHYHFEVLEAGRSRTKKVAR